MKAGLGNFRAIIVAGCAGMFAAVGYAMPTALNVIPIADTLHHGEGASIYTISGTEQRISKKYSHSYSVELGLFDKFELGYDNDFNGNTVLNIKANLLDGDQKFLKTFALSAGFTGINNNHLDKFIVARKDMGKVRLHGGYWRVADVNHAIWGTDYKFNDDVTFMADHISGSHSYTNFGIYSNIPKLKGFNAGFVVQVPGKHDDGVIHFLTITYSFRY